jgi:hypothetical protein
MLERDCDDRARLQTANKEHAKMNDRKFPDLIFVLLEAFIVVRVSWIE